MFLPEAAAARCRSSIVHRAFARITQQETPVVRSTRHLELKRERSRLPELESTWPDIHTVKIKSLMATLHPCLVKVIFCASKMMNTNDSLQNESKVLKYNLSKVAFNSTALDLSIFVVYLSVRCEDLVVCQ